MNYQSSKLGSGGSWNENVKKVLKVDISLKIILLLFVNLYVVQKSEKVKLYL